MGDRDIPDPIQEILDKLEQVRAREQELIVQLSILLRALSGQNPARPQRQGPRIRLVVADIVHLSSIGMVPDFN